MKKVTVFTAVAVTFYCESKMPLISFNWSSLMSI